LASTQALRPALPDLGALHGRLGVLLLRLRLIEHGPVGPGIDDEE
jgi:hypothetical protein